MIIIFELKGCAECKHGVVPPKTVDGWPTACPCENRKTMTQYELARRLDEDPQALVRVHHLRAKGDVSQRVLDKLLKTDLL